ncbi:hypothetical protein SAY86_027489 [Trapa natans]|uniref:Nuclear pore complex protein n=1 Tax=Trapa natans TaxID=22666 RepID=A0AAN7QJ76_TRANT|nr:hypothetical protein SAY86_027489 [Trapa natans]
MATAGFGAGGKFRKKSFRRPQSTPYDRPTAIRAPALVPSTDGDGWLRKLMDPAQKLLATTARRFYNSVFRKRLTQPPPSATPSLPQVTKEEALDKHVATISLNISKEQEVAFRGDQKPTHTIDPAEASSLDLEEILKQKSFTRSEIDHLVALLCDRVVDNPVEKEDKTPDVLPSRSSLFLEMKEGPANIPMQDNRSGSNINSSNAMNSCVRGADVNSPSELARAYMDIRSSKVLPPVLGLRCEAAAEDSPVLNNLIYSPISPILSLVPSSSGHVGIRENGYAMHRSRGRSAIYSMARSPYSKVHASSAMMNPGPTKKSYDESSSIAEGNMISGSSKPLKRSGSIFENDIGSSGPMRRIRPKSNLSYPRNWTISTSETGEQPSSSMKMQSRSGKKHRFAEHSNVAPVSSMSGKMATTIFQQLEMIVSPLKDRSSEPRVAVTGGRSSAKLSPSKLQGQALKSLEYIDSSKFLQFTQDNNKSDGVFSVSGETNKEKHGRVEQNGSFSIFSSSDKQSPKVNHMNNDIIGKKETVLVCRTGDTNAVNSLRHSQVQKTHAFKMSADEDFLDSEDDGYSNGVSSSIIRVTEKQNTHAVEIKPSVAQATSILQRNQLVHNEQGRDSLAKTSSQGANGKPMVAQTCADFSLPSLPATSTNYQSDLMPIQSLSGPTNASMFEPNATPISSGLKVDSPKKHLLLNPVSGFASHNEFNSSSSDKNSQLKLQTSSGELTSQKIPLDSVQSLSRDASASGGLFSSVARVPGSDTVQDKKSFTEGAFSCVPGATVAYVPTSSAILAFGVNSSTVYTVSTAISADSNTITSEKPLSIPSFPVTFGNGSSSKLSSTITATTSLANTVSYTSSVATEEAKHKADIDPMNISSNSFAAVNSSSGSNIFGFGATPVVSSNNQKGTANGPTPVPESPAAGPGVASLTQNVPIQFGPSSSSKLSSSIAASTSSSLCDLSCAAKPFSSGTPFGSGTLPSSQSSFLNQTSSSLFGQTTATLTFASSQNSKSPSIVFPFNSSPSSSGFVFGSVSGSCSAPIFAFGSAPGTTGSSSNSSEPSVFGLTSMSSSSASPAASVFGLNVATSPAALGSSACSSTPTFGLSDTSSIFGSAGSSATFGASSVFGSSDTSTLSASPAASVFGLNIGTFPATPGSSSASSSASTFGLPGSSSIFGSIGSSPTSGASSVFGSINTSTSSASHAALVFGSNMAASNTSPIFGSMGVSSVSTNPTLGSTFSFSSVAASPSPSPVFGSTNSPFTFGSPASPIKINTDQMIMEDTMAGDVVQSNHASTPPAPVFSQQQPITPPSGFVFGSNASGANPFQFGVQQKTSTAQSPSPFQASGSLDFNAGGGSFSLGSGGGDKSGRKIVKINRNKLRRK